MRYFILAPAKLAPVVRGVVDLLKEKELDCSFDWTVEPRETPDEVYNELMKFGVLYADIVFVLGPLQEAGPVSALAYAEALNKEIKYLTPLEYQSITSIPKVWPNSNMRDGVYVIAEKVARAFMAE